MRILIQAGLAVTVGLAVTLASGLSQAVQASQPGLAHRGVLAASPAGPVVVPQTTKLLYTQDNHAAGPSANLVSDYKSKGNSSNAQAADDFTVPKGKTWTIDQVDVAGSDTDGSPASETVFFYRNAMNAKKQDVPGVRVKKATLKGKDNGTGSLVITGIRGVTLTAGHYWVSVQGNVPSPNPAYQWFWSTRTVQSGSPAVWRNPGNGFGTGCTAWSNMKSCAAVGGVSDGPDFMFALYGSSTS